MGKHYANKADIEATIGFTITSTSRPNTTKLDGLLGRADKMINTEMIRETNITDSTGLCKNIECRLVRDMVHNIFHFSHPKEYDLIDVRLSPEDKRDIHYALRIWKVKSWEVGE